MKRSSWQRVDLFWREVFGVDPCAGAIVEHGAMLGGFDGVLVVVRRGAALISAPARMHGDIARWRPTAEAAASATWWRGRLPGWEVRGPSVHAFLDRSDQLPATTAEADVRVARMEDLTPLRERVPAEEWSERLRGR